MSAVLDLEREKRAAEALRSKLAGITDEDWTLTVESETNFVEAVDKALKEIDDAQALVLGIEAMGAQLEERRTRYDGRIKKLKEAICLAMQVGEVQKLERPSATLSLKRVPPGLVITDEKQIPMDYFVRQDPRLDRKAVMAALKDKQDVPGCTLDNGSITIAFRRA